jgi:transposase
MANEKRKYEPAFKAEAVRLVQEHGRTVADVAKSLDVHVNTLHGWVREAAPGGKRVHRPEADEQVRRLERELRRVTEERDILKKAVAFFASERK